MVDLPRPKVEVISTETSAGSTVDIVISRDNKARSYSGGGSGGKSKDGATAEAVEKILNDVHIAEYLPESKKGVDR